MSSIVRVLRHAWLGCVLLSWLPSAAAQDMEPRRWTPLPVDLNIVGVGMAHTRGDVLLRPALQIEDATYTSTWFALSYQRTFAAFGNMARFDARLPFYDAKWQGLLRGEQASAFRKGLGDPLFRLSYNFIGSPAISEDEFIRRRSRAGVNTVVGAAVSLTVPAGEYMPDRLLNLGSNQFVIRPQLGALHTRGPWSFELSGSVFLFTDNDEFFGETTYARAPLWTAQAHVTRALTRGLWLGAGGAAGLGGRTTVGSDDNDDRLVNWMGGGTLGFQYSTTQSTSLRYGYLRAVKNVGSNLHTVSLAWTVRF